MAAPIDTSAPWTIKSVGTRTRNAATEAARKEGLTVGQWLDKRVAEWVADGGPVPVTMVAAVPGPVVAVSELAELMRATQSLAEGAGVEIPKGAARHALALMTTQLRAARGMPALAPRKSPSLSGQTLNGRRVALPSRE